MGWDLEELRQRASKAENREIFGTIDLGLVNSGKHLRMHASRNMVQGGTSYPHKLRL